MPLIHKQKKTTCVSSGTQNSWSPVDISVMCLSVLSCNLYHTGTTKRITAPASVMRLKRYIKKSSLAVGQRESREAVVNMSGCSFLLPLYSSPAFLPLPQLIQLKAWALLLEEVFLCLLLNSRSSCSDLFLPMCCDAVMILPQKSCLLAMNSEEFNTDQEGRKAGWQAGSITD